MITTTKHIYSLVMENFYEALKLKLIRTDKRISNLALVHQLITPYQAIIDQT